MADSQRGSEGKHADQFKPRDMIHSDEHACPSVSGVWRPSRFVQNTSSAYMHAFHVLALAGRLCARNIHFNLSMHFRRHSRVGADAVALRQRAAAPTVDRWRAQLWHGRHTGHQSRSRHCRNAALSSHRQSSAQRQRRPSQHECRPGDAIPVAAEPWVARRHGPVSGSARAAPGPTPLFQRAAVASQPGATSFPSGGNSSIVLTVSYLASSSRYTAHRCCIKTSCGTCPYTWWQGGGDADSFATDLEGDGEDIYVWGTNLTIASVTQRIRRFFMNFKAGGQAEDDDAKYIGLIRQVPASVTVLSIFFLLQRQNWEGENSGSRI